MEKTCVFMYPNYTEKIGSKQRVEFPPLGMLYICSVFEEKGYCLSVFPVDDSTELDQIPNASIYCFSITSSVVYPKMRELALLCKAKQKAEIFIAGGMQVSIFPDLVLNELSLDAVFVGESEGSILKWLSGNCKKRGIIIPSEFDIDEIPFPNRKLLPDSLIYMNHRVGGAFNNVISIITSRGCVFKCGFCGVPSKGNKVKFRSAESIDIELRQILLDFPLCSGLTIMDETFTLNEKHIYGVTSVIKKHGLPYECNSRADTLNDNKIRYLSESGCKEIRIGLETASQRLLDYMNKSITIEHVIKSLKLLKKYDIPVKLYIMHGYPTENMESTLETIDFLYHYREYISRISLYRFVPLPGSVVYGELSPNCEWGDFTIYDNGRHWWGNLNDYQEVNDSYGLLKHFVDTMFDTSKI